MPPKFRPCRECGGLIELKITRDLTRKKFCSRACGARFHGRYKDMRPVHAKSCTPEANAKKSHPGSANPKWLPIGSMRQTHDMGYVEVKIAEPNVWQYEHRIIAKAPADLVVHHKDGDVRNNDPANLQLMDANEHLQMHARQRREHNVSR